MTNALSSVPDRRHKHALKRYGMTPEEYSSLLEVQKGGCAVCGKKCTRRLAVDHDHETGRVRGLLCMPCNTAIGSLRDSPALVAKAVVYLLK